MSIGTLSVCLTGAVWLLPDCGGSQVVFFSLLYVLRDRKREKMNTYAQKNVKYMCIGDTYFSMHRISCPWWMSSCVMHLRSRAEGSVHPRGHQAAASAGSGGMRQSAPGTPCLVTGLETAAAQVTRALPHRSGTLCGSPACTMPDCFSFWLPQYVQHRSARQYSSRCLPEPPRWMTALGVIQTLPLASAVPCCMGRRGCSFGSSPAWHLMWTLATTYWFLCTLTDVCCSDKTTCEDLCWCSWLF